MEILFENPDILWFLLAVPLLVLGHFYWLRHAKRRAMKFANFRALKRVTGKKLITRNYTVLGVRILVLVAAVLAASQPTAWTEGMSNENAYVIAIDTSASMQAADIPPNRIDAAKEYAKVFIDEAPGRTEFGIVTFSSVTFVEQTMTADRAELKDTINAIDPKPAGGTDIPGAVIASTNLLLGNEQGKEIILITDGSNTQETFAASSIKTGAEYAKQHHVTINTIGIGTTSGPIGYLPTYYNVSSIYNEENLAYIANETGGIYHHATDIESLRGAYNAISGRVEEQLLPYSLTEWLLVAALILLLLDWLLISTRFRTIP